MRWIGRSSFSLGACLGGLAVLPLGVALGATLSDAREPPALAPVLSTGKTVLDQMVVYPKDAPARVTAAILTLPPGGETGWHAHPAPTFGFVLEGEMTVDYGGGATRVFRKGDGLLEAVTVSHNGRNTGAGEARILSASMGADGLEPSVPAEPPR